MADPSVSVPSPPARYGPAIFGERAFEGRNAALPYECRKVTQTTQDKTRQDKTRGDKQPTTNRRGEDGWRADASHSRNDAALPHATTAGPDARHTQAATSDDEAANEDQTATNGHGCAGRLVMAAKAKSRTKRENDETCQKTRRAHHERAAGSSRLYLFRGHI